MYVPWYLVGQEIMWWEQAIADNRPTITCIAANKYLVNSNVPVGGESKDSANEKSLAFIVKFNNFRYYIGGDIESPQEDILCEYLNPNNTLAGRVQAVKLSHHGSSGASSKTFLNRLKPTATFISCGLFNAYPHPSLELIKRVYPCALDGYSSSDNAEKALIKASKPVAADSKNDADAVIAVKEISWNLEACYLTGFPLYNGVSLPGAIYQECNLEEVDPYIIAGTFASGAPNLLPIEPYTPGDIVIDVSQAMSLLRANGSQGPLFNVSYTSYSNFLRQYKRETGKH